MLSQSNTLDNGGRLLVSIQEGMGERTEKTLEH